MSRLKMFPALLLAVSASGCGGDDAPVDRGAPAPGNGSSTSAAEGPSAAERAEAAAAPAAGPAPYLFAWAADVDRADSDFLAVLDADPG
ncbi:MAG: hypothetical protein ACOC9N_00595, partial [Gemmatimonadota bacterium]